MLDTSTPEGRVIAAALKLAESEPWSKVHLNEIAQEAGVSLAELRRTFDGKTAILLGLMRAVDEAVLAQASDQIEADDRPRDRIFDVLMGSAPSPQTQRPPRLS